MPALFSLYLSGRFPPSAAAAATSTGSVPSASTIASLGALRAGQLKVREALSRKLCDTFTHALARVQAAEEGIREFVRQRRLDGSWDRMLEHKAEEIRAQKAAAAAAVAAAAGAGAGAGASPVPSGAGPSSGEDADVPWKGDYPFLGALPPSPIDCFLAYRTRAPTAATLFDLLSRPVDGSAGRAGPLALRRQGDAILDEWERGRDRGREDEGARALCAPQASCEASGVSGLLLAKAMVDRARELPPSSPATALPPLSACSEALEAEKRLFFSQHTMRLNPALQRLLQGALDAPESGQNGAPDAAAPSTQFDPSPESDPDDFQSGWVHLTRPSPYRVGALPLPHCLAVLLLEPKLLRVRQFGGGRAVRFFPAMVWELWRSLLGSVFLRALPAAFAGYRRAIDEVGIDQEQARLLRGQRVASRQGQGQGADSASAADDADVAADCDAVAARARACGIHVPRLVYGDLVWVDEAGFPSGDARALADLYDSVWDAAALAEERARVPRSLDLSMGAPAAAGSGGAGAGANDGGGSGSGSGASNGSTSSSGGGGVVLDAATEAFHENARHRALRARMSRTHQRRMEQIQAGLVHRGLPPLLPGQSAAQRAEQELHKYAARCAKADAEFQRRMGEIAQRKQEEEWRTQRAVWCPPSVSPATRRLPAATPAAAAVSDGTPSSGAR